MEVPADDDLTQAVRGLEVEHVPDGMRRAGGAERAVRGDCDRDRATGDDRGVAGDRLTPPVADDERDAPRKRGDERSRRLCAGRRRDRGSEGERPTSAAAPHEPRTGDERERDKARDVRIEQGEAIDSDRLERRVVLHADLREETPQPCGDEPGADAGDVTAEPVTQVGRHDRDRRRSWRARR